MHNDIQIISYCRIFRGIISDIGYREIFRVQWYTNNYWIFRGVRRGIFRQWRHARQRCNISFMAYHIREISHRRNDITARNISPVDSNKVEERNISSKLCTLKPNQCASLPSRLFKEYSHAQQQLFTSHFRYILKLFTLHLDLKEHRNGQLKYTHRYISFIEQSQFRFVHEHKHTHTHTHTHRSIYFRREITFFSLAVFSPWNKFSFFRIEEKIALEYRF